MEQIVSTETPFIKDRPTAFLNQTIFNPSVAKRLAPAPEIAETPQAKQEKEEAFTKAIQQIKDSNFTATQVNSLLKNMLNGFATEDRGWNQDTMRASLAILPFIGLKKLYPSQIVETYMEAVVTTLPSNQEVRLEGGMEALIEAGIILLPNVSRSRNKKQIEVEVIPVLRRQLEQRLPNTNNEAHRILSDKITYLSNSLKAKPIKPPIKPLEISPKDRTEITNKLREFCKEFRWKHPLPEEFVKLDALVLEAIRDFGMNSVEIREISDGLTIPRLNDSIRRLKANGFIPDRNVYEDTLTLQVQDLLGKGTSAQIANALGPGITRSMVDHAKHTLRERGYNQGSTNIQEDKIIEERIIDFKRQGFSNSRIVDQLDLPLTTVRKIIEKLRNEKKIEQKTRGGRNLNNPGVIKAIEIDATVDMMISNNPEMSYSDIVRKLNLTKSEIYGSRARLKQCKALEGLTQQGNTPEQIANNMGIDKKQAEFLVARLQKLRDLQRNLQNQSPLTG